MSADIWQNAQKEQWRFVQIVEKPFSGF